MPPFKWSRKEDVMSEQVHRRLGDEQVKMILGRYAAKELTAAQAMELLGLRRRQYFEWVQRYREDPEGFTIQYRRKEKSRKVDLKMVPYSETGLTDIRFWHNGRLVSTQKIKTSDLPIVRF